VVYWNGWDIWTDSTRRKQHVSSCPTHHTHNAINMGPSTQNELLQERNTKLVRMRLGGCEHGYSSVSCNQFDLHSLAEVVQSGRGFIKDAVAFLSGNGISFR